MRQKTDGNYGQNCKKETQELFKFRDLICISNEH